MIDNSKEYILCAAVRRVDGNVDYGYRHDKIYSRVPKEDIEKVYGIDFWDDMGFLTSRNRFVGRKEAYQIALACGQVKPRKEKDDMSDEFGLKVSPKDMEWLASEDLY